MFGRKGKIEEIDQPEPGDCTARVEVSGKGKLRKVKARLIRHSDGATVYVSEYESSKSDVFAYHVAIEALEKHAEYEALAIIRKLTNIDLPYIQNVSKGSRW